MNLLITFQQFSKEKHEAVFQLVNRFHQQTGEQMGND